jgi:hypothetical protein
MGGLHPEKIDVQGLIKLHRSKNHLPAATDAARRFYRLEGATSVAPLSRTEWIGL